MGERYQLGISQVGRREIADKIQNQDGVFVSASSRYRSVWLVEYRGRIVRVVYSKRTKDLVTALPMTNQYIDLWDKKKVDKDPRNNLYYI